jgi:hypothetical protein
VTRVCSECPDWKPEPLWKQVLFVWRGGLWLGRCHCFRGELSWHCQQCGKTAPQEGS